MKSKNTAPAKSLRPKERPMDMTPKGEKGDSDLMKMRDKDKATKKAYGGKVKKMAKGGKCRGMGVATRGGEYKMG